MNRRVLIVGLILTLPLIGILLANLGRDPRDVNSPLIGRPAPLFTLPVAGGGSTVSLAELRGRPVVLNFWATWCVPCEEEHGVLRDAARAMGKDVHFVAIVYEDDEARILSYLEQRGRAYASLMDQGSKTAIAYGIFGVPETFFIDAQGTIVSKFKGPLTPGALAANIRQAMGSGQ